MKKWNKAAFLVVAASLLATPAVLTGPTSAYAINKSEAEVIPLPADLVQVLKDLKEDYVPALGNLHTDSFVKDGSEYRIALSDKKSKITAGISLSLAVDENGNILSLELSDPDREKTKHFDKEVQYKQAVSFIREQVGIDHAVASQGFLSTRKGTGTENLMVVPFYQTQNDIPVNKQMGEVMVDADGQIVKFYQKKQKLPLVADIADPKKAVTNDLAKQSWEKALSMKLVYDQEKAKLVYIPENEPKIDSLTGQVIPGIYVEDQEELKIKGTSTKDLWKNQKNMEKMLGEGLNLTVSRLKYDFVTEKDKKSDIDVYEWKSVVNETATITLDRKTRTPIQVTLDGQAEAILEKPITVNEGKKLALQYVEKYLLVNEQSFELKTTSLTDKLPAWVDQKQGRLQPSYRFDFYPQTDGIPTKKPLYTIEIDANKGKVVQVRVSDTVSPPSNLNQKGLIGEKQAKETFLKTVYLRQDYWYAKAGNQTADIPQLVYIATESSLSHAIDAHSGATEDDWLEWEE
ncbi:hypothetical protein [Brevibacillus choshinensis]|uniref:hypothetical protein n=1 Tax=Brevibacillus choshinensis TaxID=54911 RepID=UPI002E1D1EF8|nr:hypothetical protein [Brevibacillus choshinensis]